MATVALVHRASRAETMNAVINPSIPHRGANQGCRRHCRGIDRALPLPDDRYHNQAMIADLRRVAAKREFLITVTRRKQWRLFALRSTAQTFAAGETLRKLRHAGPLSRGCLRALVALAFAFTLPAAKQLSSTVFPCYQSIAVLPFKPG